jgi:hypothetical protein
MSESRGGLSQATSARAFGGEVQAVWRLGMAACNSPRVLQPFARDVVQLCPGRESAHDPGLTQEGSAPQCRRNLKNAFRSRCEPAAQSTVTLVRYARRRVHCANEVEDAVPPRV